MRPSLLFLLSVHIPLFSLLQRAVFFFIISPRMYRTSTDPVSLTGLGLLPLLPASIWQLPRPAHLPPSSIPCEPNSLPTLAAAPFLNSGSRILGVNRGTFRPGALASPHLFYLNAQSIFFGLQNKGTRSQRRWIAPESCLAHDRQRPMDGEKEGSRTIGRPLVLAHNTVLCSSHTNGASLLLHPACVDVHE